jgi:Bifunctional DNA primase/polymerase, N-terminal
LHRPRNSACEYAARGWSVIPLRQGTKIPDGQLVPHGKDDASADLATVFRWWSKRPEDGIAINCGESGLVVLDIDPRHGGDDSLHELEKQLGKLPVTVTAITGGGGEHILFSHPGFPLVGVLAPGIDIKDNGYIVASPSIHPSGKRYEWSVDGHPELCSVAPLPAAWLEAMRKKSTLGEKWSLNLAHDEPLRDIPASVYIPRLTGRAISSDDFIQCPFHKGGIEKTPSLKIAGTLWACYGCDPPRHKQCMGGNIFDFAGYLRHAPVPLRGVDFIEAKQFLMEEFS